MGVIRQVLEEVTGKLEDARREKRIGYALEASPKVYAPSTTATLFDGLDVAEIFRTSSSTFGGAVVPSPGARVSDVGEVYARIDLASGEKCARCWRFLPEVHAP